MQKITPFLWFDTQAEEAAEFYTSIFKNSRIKDIHYYGTAASKAAGRPEGSVMTVNFELDGQELVALNGGPVFQFTPAMSLVVNCDSQDEIDKLWKRLSEGGREDQCGWLQDRFGISWQIVPTQLTELLTDSDENRSERAWQAMLQMKKLDIDELEHAHTHA